MMALLYADEGFPRQVSNLLRELDHDVLTVQEANQRIPDDEVLAYATRLGRAVLTVNRADFIKLHKQSSNHSGIIVCTENLNRKQLADRIHDAISSESTLAGKLIRINRPSVI
jgi:predicted nuclease of predicted toxin-antitoxin system